MGSIDRSTPDLTRDAVEAAHKLIKEHIHLTPVQTNTTLSTLASTPQTAEALKGSQWDGQEPAKPKIRLFFKCENFQRIGAFKVRGAFHAIKRLIEEKGLEEVRKKGVVTHSSGMPYFGRTSRIESDYAYRKSCASSCSCSPLLFNPRAYCHANDLYPLEDRRHKSTRRGGALQRFYLARARGRCGGRC